jgi:predicted component of type VI protein secretion system
MRGFQAVCALVVLTGCATVAPYERERLARRDMQLDRNPELNAGQEHATDYREGSSGGEGTSGGGCGCN